MQRGFCSHHSSSRGTHRPIVSVALLPSQDCTQLLGGKGFRQHTCHRASQGPCWAELCVGTWAERPTAGPVLGRRALSSWSWNNHSWTDMAWLPNTWFMAEMLPSAVNDTPAAYKDVWVLFQKKKKIRLLPSPSSPAINDSSVRLALASCYEDVLTYQRGGHIIGSLPSTPPPYLCLKSQDMLPALATFSPCVGDL